jgi:hypothetical protein
MNRDKFIPLRNEYKNYGLAYAAYMTYAKQIKKYNIMFDLLCNIQDCTVHYVVSTGTNPDSSIS